MRPDADSRAATSVKEPEPPVTGQAEPTSTVDGGLPSVHRLRDLGPRDRLIALVLGLVLLVAPVSSAVRQFGTWTPGGDDALIELRARDVATSQRPLIGQPSSSSLYGRRERNAAHPGPIEFYLLAPAERVLGGGMGMLSTIAAISGASVVVAAWAVFRQLGRGAGLAAAVALAAVMWTSGAAAIVDPRSSAVGRFPLLCSVVLVWCLVCGDVRLLALTCAWLSFTLQQHLSIVPCRRAHRRGRCGGPRSGARAARRASRPRRPPDGGAKRRCGQPWSVSSCGPRSCTSSSPGRPGNLERIARYAGDKTRSDVGYGSALRQVAHAIGLPPLLGRINVTGPDMLARVSVVTGVSAVAAVVLLIAGAVLWRRKNPRLTALVVVAGAVVVGGLINGANVPNSLEQTRIAFYHWAFTLAFLEFLILLLAVSPPLWRWFTHENRTDRSCCQGLAGPLVCLLVLAPAVGNLIVHRDRQSTAAVGSEARRSTRSSPRSAATPARSPGRRC